MGVDAGHVQHDPALNRYTVRYAVTVDGEARTVEVSLLHALATAAFDFPHQLGHHVEIDVRSVELVEGDR
ncbi:MAG TPA: hypothetical protein VK611_17105 [Acidimicrobiales bacterium]|nr:hypothetical protein [Acidimicrobiales bacterium]